jgi:hypothetical protein
MKKFIFVLFLLFCIFSFSLKAQNIRDFKVKNAENAAERTLLLDMFRAKLYEEYAQEFAFVVDVFKVNKQYAWFSGRAQRKDGKEILLKVDEDCCGVQALFKKSGKKWLIAASAAFPTDAWYDHIWEEYPGSEELFEKIED